MRVAASNRRARAGTSSPGPALRRRVLAAAALLGCCTAHAATVENIRVWSEDGRTRVVLDLDGPARHNIFTLRGPDRLVVDLEDSEMSPSLADLPGATGTLAGIRTGRRADGGLRIVLDLAAPVRSRSFVAGPNAKHGDRLVVDLHQQGNLETVQSAADRYQEGRDIVIAVDAGHGGHDPGAIGHARTREKDVALAIARELAERIDQEPGMKSVLVRDGDYYVDHRERMRIARETNADLFVSIHADSVKDGRAHGASVYVLSLDGASDEAARLLAKRENAAVIGGVSLADKDDLLASVLLDLSQNAALSASLSVGSSVLDELAKVGSMHRRKVQQAGFLVLKSPDVPSILVETAFISNPSEEARLSSPTKRREIAKAILAGVRTYFYRHPPPDTQLAMLLRSAPEGQVRYVIARGDTLSEIAERYNVSLSVLRATNRLSGDTLRVGQTLNIPIPNTGS